MNISKIVGCASVIAFSALLGYFYSQKEMKKLHLCEEIYLFLRKLEYGIGKRIPLNDIISGHMSVVKPRYLVGNNKDELVKCLGGFKNDGICAEPIQLCEELLDTVGKSPDGGEQQKRCGMTADRVAEMLCAMRGECGNKKDLYPKLGVILGILVCITVI